MVSTAYFFFRAEDGIRGRDVTGVQTCALPISAAGAPDRRPRLASAERPATGERAPSGAVSLAGAAVRVADGVLADGVVELDQIGRASCRERGESWVVAAVVQPARMSGRSRAA